MTDRELRRLCYEANRELPRLGLVIYTFGNVSVSDRDRGIYAIKPSGIDYDRMRPRDMVLVDLAGKVVGGRLRPSSDAPTHTVLYNAFPAVGGIVHTHSAYATGWAQARRPVPIYGTTHADHLPGDIPCTDLMSDESIQGDYETETGRQITALFERDGLDPAETPMVLVAGHGPFTWGDSAAKAVYHARVCEELCRMALVTERAAATAPAARLKETLTRKHYRRKHGEDAYYGQST